MQVELPLIVDSFAGGGGASTGIEMALGRSPDIAINHSADALAMHMVNHPATLHLDSNIWDVSPAEVCKGRRVGLFWASPDCKHFSKAKGGKPLDRNIRDLAWVVVRWAEEVKPDVIILENVEEFVTWGPLYEDGKPIVELRGQTFEDWTRRLKRAGYKVQWRELRACDYGAPTIRKRFFMIARRDGKPIVWPAKTHGDPKKPEDAKLIAKGVLKPWRTAAEIIDWSLPCPSIFETSEEIMAKYGVRAVRPLAEATMRRISRGVIRYVLEAKKPFIVRTDMASAAKRNGVHAVDDPVNTLTTAGSFAVVSPVVTYAQQGGGNRPADEPIHTITASPKDQNSLIVPSFVGCGGRAGQSAPSGGDEPAGTMTAKADGCVVAAHLTKFQSNSIGSDLDEPVPTITANSYIKRPGGAAPIGVAAVHLSRFTQNGVGSDADEPVDTVMAGAPKFGVVAAFLAQHNSGNDGHDARKPLSTLTGGGQGGVSQQGVIAANLLNLRGSDRRDAAVDAPVQTVSAQGNHAALISGFLTKYYGTGDGATIDGPLHTDTTKDRFGLVTVDIDGHTYAIADIGIRAQGFPDSYVIDRRIDGSPITATVQGSCCGNSVCPPLAEALVAANCNHMAVQREAAE